jgi:hypothetical protein
MHLSKSLCYGREELETLSMLSKDLRSPAEQGMFIDRVARSLDSWAIPN